MHPMDLESTISPPHHALTREEGTKLGDVLINHTLTLNHP